MDICRLCLEPGGQNIPNPAEILDILKKFLPSINPCLKCSLLLLCETCLCNINTLKNLNDILEKTDEKIEIQMKDSKVEKLDLIYLLETRNGIGTKTKNIYLCRICLQIIHFPKVFLYENDTNILRCDLISNMFLFCNITLKCDISQRPVMCLQCWENIQVCYSFKKNYIETDKKIRAYLTQSNISRHAINEEVLKNISQYISTEMNGTIKNNEELCDKREDIKGYSLRRNVKKEYVNGMPSLKKMNAGCNSVIRPKRTRYNFTTEDDKILLEFYSEATNRDSNIGTRPWKCIQEKWLNKFPNNPLKVTSIHRRLILLLKRKQNGNLQQKCPPKNETTVKKVLKDNKVVNIFGGVPPDDQDGESDDSFVDEIIPASFMPNIKSEPLSDDEIYVIEPKMDHFTDIPPSGSDSDSESLPIPILERMDLPAVWKVDHNSVDSKRETMELINQNNKIGSSTAIEDIKSYKRTNVICKKLHETLYKCTECNFETKYQYSADRHANWHANPNKKGYKCDKCSFITTKQFFLKQHLTDNHRHEDEEDEELPVLIPFTIHY